MHTIETKSMFVRLARLMSSASEVHGYLASATFTNLLLFSGVVLCEAMGL